MGVFVSNRRSLIIHLSTDTLLIAYLAAASLVNNPSIESHEIPCQVLQHRIYYSHTIKSIFHPLLLYDGRSLANTLLHQHCTTITLSVSTSIHEMQICYVISHTSTFQSFNLDPWASIVCVTR
jgi:hypothetical protein